MAKIAGPCRVMDEIPVRKIIRNLSEQVNRETNRKKDKFSHKLFPVYRLFVPFIPGVEKIFLIFKNTIFAALKKES
jgi:hypothetical protein